MREALKESSFARLLSEIFEDVGVLFRQEIHLAKTEMSVVVAEQVRATIYFLVAGLFGLITVLMLCQATVFALINHGMASHWACLTVTAAAGAIAVIAFVVARTKITRVPLPSRAFHQVKQDIATAKETLS